MLPNAGCVNIGRRSFANPSLRCLPVAAVSVTVAISRLTYDLIVGAQDRGSWWHIVDSFNGPLPRVTAVAASQTLRPSVAGHLTLPIGVVALEPRLPGTLPGHRSAPSQAPAGSRQLPASPDQTSVDARLRLAGTIRRAAAISCSDTASTLTSRPVTTVNCASDTCRATSRATCSGTWMASKVRKACHWLICQRWVSGPLSHTARVIGPDSCRTS